LERTCGGCHTGQANVVTSGHAVCEGCHEPHSGKTRARCESCHAPQLSALPRGHQRCQTCHEPHAGSILPGVSCGRARAVRRRAARARRSTCL
jgi:hypothetical protein